MQKQYILDESVREYTEKSRRVAAPQGSRILTVYHGNGESFYDDPDVTLTSSIPADAQEYITSGVNGAYVEEVARLLAEQSRLRLNVKRAWGSLNKTAYGRVVSLYTSGWKRIRLPNTLRPIGLKEALDRGYGHWKTRWRKEEMITPLERLLRILHTSGSSLTKSTKDSLWESIRRLRLQIEASGQPYDIPQNRTVKWRTEPYKVFVPAVEGIRVHEQDGALSLFVIEKHFKTVPSRDWTAIRKEWLRRISIVQVKCVPLYRRLEEISARLDQIYWKRAHTFQPCIQVRPRAIPYGATVDRQTLSSFWVNHFNGYNSSTMTGNSGPDRNALRGFMPGVHASSYGFTSSQQTADRLICAVDEKDPTDWMDRLTGFNLPDGVPCRASIDHAGIAWTFCLNPILRMSTDPEEERLELVGFHYEYGALETGYATDHAPTYLEGTEPAILVNNGPNIRGNIYSPEPSALKGIRLDDDVIVDGPTVLDNRLVAASAALAAGRLGGNEAVTFNYARSLGELKDTDQSVATLNSFVAFIKEAKEHPENFWEATFSDGTRLRTFSTEWNSPRSRRRAMSRPLRPDIPYIVKIKRYTIKGNTPLRILAQAYLAYKFAIKPTVDDVNTFMHNTGEWLTASRRELTRLMRKWMDTPKKRVLRKYFRVGAFGNAPSGSPSRKQMLIFSKPGIVDTSFTDEWTLSQAEVEAMLKGDYTSFEQLTSSKDPTKTVSIKRSRKGLIWFPVPGQFSGWSSDEVSDLLTEVRKHNLMVVPPALHGERLYYSPVVSGCVFALYGWDALKKMTDGATWVDTLASLHLPRTLWELAPLSFVWEWFTNAAAIATAADDIFTADLTGLKPISGQWYSLAERIYAACDRRPDTFVMQRCIDVKWWVLVPYNSHSMGFGTGNFYCIPRYVKWEWYLAESDELQRLTPSQFWGDGVQLHRTAAVFYNRAPLTEEYAHTLPELQVRMNLDASKLLSLLAIAKAFGRGRRVVPALS